MLYSLVLAAGAFILISAWVVCYHSDRSVKPSLPPGPKGLPLIGNLFDLPPGPQWLIFDKWLKQYGDIVQINILGQPIIILGSVRAVSAIFEKNSSIHSSRKGMTMMNELMGWGFNFAFMPYGKRWRDGRRIFHQHFNQGSTPRYHHAFSRQTRRLLYSLLTEPEDFLRHIRHTFAATILAATYGLDVTDRNDPYVTISEKAMQGASAAFVPGAFLVNDFPILKYVPSWSPGAEFQRKAMEWKKATDAMFHKPFNAVKVGIREGTAGPSVAATILQSLPVDGDNREEEYAIKAVGAAAYAGATISTAQVFILAMAMHPEVQRRAQAEIDAVVGRSRLPDFSDRDSLPYINAVVKEVIRWQPAFPLGIPHASTADDEYCGYYIPKGSIIFGCSWSILHDPVAYPEPHKFIPERFLNKDGKLNPDVQDPNIAAFGYGRRICPGRYFVDDSLYSVISCILATFDIRPPTHRRAPMSELQPVMLPGIISHPAPFESTISARSHETADLIFRSLNETP
ncbi:cytochrome P450 [Neolentinus lepideus HHB14362 ss-1]|uniref:Cytochrome P450 n=1 Tax=Neolentinus lepideus HHB14362 ss-1 TaxID=1314782 RepID=A0A165RY30_9AGAM|nr:cytochrome P450 [Neolentinus lepideus HHB14362 ss-1]